MDKRQVRIARVLKLTVSVDEDENRAIRLCFGEVSDSVGEVRDGRGRRSEMAVGGGHRRCGWPRKALTAYGQK